ncbi:MAG: pyridoxamine 5'-phosphate oxidase [Bdellovibrionales bacterium]|nr:pyridoxamine 5'-phosphate oxidase [Bdellovibrionales bacterium]
MEINNAKCLLASKDPYFIFAQWLDRARQIKTVIEPTAMTLATSSLQGDPSLRTVLLKEFSPQQGFVFYTNYKSQKGRELEQNPRAALLFYWGPLFRQINIKGLVKKVSRQQSVDYWKTRPRASQLAGWTSHQSEEVPRDESLEIVYEKGEHLWRGQDIPCPEHWGGYQLMPEIFEFWVGKEFRFHDRVRFSQVKKTNEWVKVQLFP